MVLRPLRPEQGQKAGSITALRKHRAAGTKKAGQSALPGRTSGGRHPVTPWGQPTKGKKTRKNKATDKDILRSRHLRKKR